jgi:hypothetical protein
MDDLKDELREQLRQDKGSEGMIEQPAAEPCPLLSGAGNVRNVAQMKPEKFAIEYAKYEKWKAKHGPHAEVEKALRPELALRGY